MGANNNSHSKQRRLQLHSPTNTQGRKRTRNKQNKFGFPIYTDPLAHQHLNEIWICNQKESMDGGAAEAWEVRWLQ